MRTHRVATLVVGAAILVLLAGCGGGGGGTPDPVVGTWEAYQVSDSLYGPRVGIEQFGITITITLRSNKTWSAVGSAPGVPTESSSGTWSRSGNDYTITDPNDPPPDILRLRGSELYMVDYVDTTLLWVWFRKV